MRYQLISFFRNEKGDCNSRPLSFLGKDLRLRPVEEVLDIEGRTAEIYRSEMALVLGDILGEGLEEPLGVFGRHDDAALNHGFASRGKSGGEIDDEFAVGMGDNREIGIGPRRDVGTELDAQLLTLGFLIVVHIEDADLLAHEFSKKCSVFIIFAFKWKSLRNTIPLS